MKYSCIILGDGPAGITAAIYLKRANCDVLVISKGESSLLKAERIENYYGFPEGISGEKLYKDGILQASNLGIEIIKDEVLNISYDGSYLVECVNGSYNSATLIMATGNKKKSPKIQNINMFEGKGVSYCAICDGFFYRRKKVGVVGNKEYALHEASVLSNLTDDVTIYTNGEELKENRLNLKVCNKRILEVKGGDSIQELVFDDGTSEKIDGLFIAVGSASTNDLAMKLGVMTEKGKIVVNDKMETNLEGFYCCGDATGGVLQISKAVYEGTVAGLEAGKYIKNK